MNERPEALIFDFDGVLADTEPLHWKAWAARLALRGIEFSWEEYCNFGRGVQDERWLHRIPELAADPLLLSEVRLEVRAQREMVERFSREKLPIGESTIDLLHELRGFRLGLVTSSHRSEVLPMLESAQIADCFSAAVFGEDTIHLKTNPLPYLLIQEKLAIRGGVVFEDSDAGLRKPTAAGFEVIRVHAPQALPEVVRRYLCIS